MLGSAITPLLIFFLLKVESLKTTFFCMTNAKHIKKLYKKLMEKYIWQECIYLGPSLMLSF